MANKAEIELSAKDATRQAFDSVLKNLGQVKEKADYVRNGLTALSSALVGASFVGLIRSSINAADEMGKMAEKAGIAVEEFSALSFAMKKLDVDQESVNTGIKKLSISITEAAAGSTQKAAMFDALGVAYKNADGSARNSIDVLKDLATVYAKAGDGPEKLAYAVALGGKSFTDLIPALNKGGAEITRLMEAAKEAGRVMDQETADAADKFNKNLDALGNSARKLAMAMTKDMLPDLVEITNAMIEAKKESNALYALWIGMGGVVAKIFERGAMQLPDIEKELAWKSKAFLNAANQNGMDSPEAQRYKREMNDLMRRRDELKAEIELQNTTKPRAQAEKPKLDISGLKPEKEAREKAAKDLTAMYEREARAIVEGEEQAAKDTADAWKAWEQIQIRDAEEAAKMTALQWKQVYEEIDAEQERAIEDGKKYLDAIAKDGEDKFKRLEDAVRGWGNSFTDAFADAAMGAKTNFSDMVNSIIRDLIRVQVRQSITDPLVKSGTAALDGLFGRGGGGQQLSGPTDSGGGFFGGLKSLFGFASGGSFQVGGSGGTDSQLVAFRASPDETVTVTRPDQAAGGGGITVVNHINIDSRSDRGAILQAMEQVRQATVATIQNNLARSGAKGVAGAMAG